MRGGKKREKERKTDRTCVLDWVRVGRAGASMIM
jgi:hypothetical protein